MIMPFTPVVHWVVGVLCLVEIPLHHGGIVLESMDCGGDSKNLKGDGVQSHRERGVVEAAREEAEY